ncbi:methylmalonyl-CoA epimerase [[Eubacterium] contortum]|uniref:Methylmalonyl-CoA epimerase n=1 Tax=Faecalicatena contorta TaxID=39482 RepID=A0A174LHZ8_9FIRM|nr:VOC family protein [Faecalicatena contorta]CUP21270.1 methylmalonyl-CoA epimerase [[Eubacterium] contortum] [Faecalicatena contorta]
MKPEFKRLMQIGIIVRDIDEAVKKYEAMGMGPWDITVMRNDQPPFEDLTFNGEAISEKGPVMKTAMMTCYGLEFELIEPIADTVYKRWLDEHGPGIHHVAFDTEKEYETLLEDTKKETGKEPWVRGQGIHGLMDFSYLDLRDELGLIVECYSTLQPGKPALPYDMKGEVTE